MPEVSTTFTGNVGPLAAACAAAQALIDSVHGGSATIDLKVNGGAGAIAEMGKLATATDAATAAHMRHADALDRSAASARAHGDVMARAGDSAHQFGVNSDQASESMSRSSRSAGDAASQYERLSAATDRVSSAHSAAASAKRTYDEAYASSYLEAPGSTAKEKSQHATLMTAAERGAMDETHAAFQRASQEARDLRSSFGGTGSGARSLGRDVEDAAGAVGGMAGFMGNLASAADRATPSMGGIAGGLQAVGMGALYATAGAGILTAGVGALGAAGVASLAGVGAIAGAIGGGLTGLTLDAMIGSKKDPGPMAAEFAAISKQAQGLEQTAVQPYGEALAHMAHAGLAASGPMVESVKGAFTEIGKTAEGGTGSLIKSAGLLADGFADVTHSAAPAFAAALENMPALTNAVIAPTEQLAKTFGSVAAGAAAEGVPAFGRMTAAAGDLGSELLHIGANNLAPFEDDVASMIGGVTSMAKGLEPAIQPAMGAVTDVVNAVTGALGDPKVAQGIQDFAATVHSNAPDIQQGLQQITTGATSTGGAVVDTLGWAQRTGNSINEGVESSGLLSGAGSVGSGFIAAGAAEKKKADEAAAAAAADPTGLGAPQTGMAPLADLFTGRGSGGGAPSTGLQGPADIPLPPGGSARSQLAADLGVDPSQITARGGGGAAPGALQFSGGGGPPPGAPHPAGPAPGGAAGPAPGPADPGQSIQSMQSLGPAAGQAMGQVQSAVQTGAPTAFSPLIQSAGQAAQSMQTQVPQAAGQAMQGAAQQIQSAPVAQAMGSQMAHMSQMMDQGSSVMEAGGASMGAAMSGGLAQGITTTITVVDTIIRKHITKIIDIASDALDAHSPSRKFAALGESMPMGLAVGTDAAAGQSMSAVSGMMDGLVDTASAAAGGSRVKEVGETWATNIVDGAVGIFKATDLKQLTMPQIPSLMGKSDLGKQGLLGPAGSGAFTDKSLVPQNQLPTAGQAGSTQVVVHNYMDGIQIDTRMKVLIDAYMRDLDDALA